MCSGVETGMQPHHRKPDAPWHGNPIGAGELAMERLRGAQAGIDIIIVDQACACKNSKRQEAGKARSLSRR